MKQVLIAASFLLLFNLQTYSQKKSKRYFLNSFVAGTSLTYIWDTENYPNTQVVAYRYNEYTWNINMAASVSKGLFVGIQAMTLFTNSTRSDNAIYNIYGLFAQYDCLAYSGSKWSLILESSINTGDYFTGGWEDPYRREGLYYYGIGGGLEIPLSSISDKLFLDLSFYSYDILNKIKEKYNYTQYIIGLNYHFGKPRKP